MEKYIIELDRSEMDILHSFLKIHYKDMENDNKKFAEISDRIPDVYRTIINNRKATAVILGKTIEQIEKGYGMK